MAVWRRGAVGGVSDEYGGDGFTRGVDKGEGVNLFEVGDGAAVGCLDEGRGEKQY